MEKILTTVPGPEAHMNGSSQRQNAESNPPALEGVRIFVPLTRQANGYACGVVALQSVLHYFGHAVRADRLSEALAADPQHGTNYRRMVAYAQQSGLSVVVSTEMELETLRQLINAGTPVIVALQAWAADPAPGYQDDWEDGHYVVVVGYDRERFYFMDPSTLGNYTYIPTQTFLERWHDCYEEAGEIVRLSRFGMAFSGAEVCYRPDDVLPME